MGLTKLQAVNEMLASVRRAPINSLSGTLQQDAAMAVNTLDAVEQEVQEQGWSFNTEIDVEFQPASDGRIYLPSTVFRFTPNQTKNSSDPVKRGELLYDRKEKSYDFTGSVFMTEVVRRLNWDDLPFAAQNYIMHKASRSFSSSILGETQRNAPVEELEAYAALLRYETDATRANILANPTVLGGTGWRRRL